MKIYRCSFYDSVQGACLSWHASYYDAVKYLRRLQHDRGGPAQGPEGVDLIEFPTDKKGLLAWLNANFTTDNG